jgi:hypothetical protein
MLFSMMAITVATISLCLLATMWRLCVVDIILVFTTLMRGLMAHYMINLLKDEKCLNYLSDLFFKHLTTTFFFADLIILRTNIRVTFLIAFPIFIGISAFNNVTRLKFMQENGLGICQTANTSFLTYGAMFIPTYLPLLCAVYLTALNELRLFQMGENTAKQQAMMLEIFSNQRDGVALIAKS